MLEKAHILLNIFLIKNLNFNVLALTLNNKNRNNVFKIRKLIIFKEKLVFIWIKPKKDYEVYNINQKS